MAHLGPLKIELNRDSGDFTVLAVASEHRPHGGPLVDLRGAGGAVASEHRPHGGPLVDLGMTEDRSKSMRRVSE